MISAVAYVVSWKQYGWPIFSIVQIPELMNIIGAGLYLGSGAF